MAIRPLGERVVLRVIEDTEQTSGGIFIPDSAKEKPYKGEIVAVGKGKMLESGEREELDVKVGDIVLYEKYQGKDVKIDNEMFKIIAVKELLGVIE